MDQVILDQQGPAIVNIDNLRKERPMFPHCFDSTMLNAFRSCPQKAFRTYVEHWKPIAESVHLVAGKAFAKGIETARDAYFNKGATADDAMASGLEALLKAYGSFEPPPQSAKTPERMAGALEFYFDRYPLEHDHFEIYRDSSGKAAVEFSFCEPTDVVHPVTGDPILFTGRADALGNYGGYLLACDEKTTSSLGASWVKQWEMRGQFTSYTWAARRVKIPLQGALVRGVSILKTKYDTAEVPSYRTQDDIDRWYKQTLRDLERAKKMWAEGYWDYNLGEACNEYGGCSLVGVCRAKDPYEWLKINFTRRVWDPLAREELTVEEWERSWNHIPRD